MSFVLANEDNSLYSFDMRNLSEVGGWDRHTYRQTDSKQS